VIFNYSRVDITGDSRLVMHNGNPPSGQPVEEAAFADIRPPDKRYRWQTVHIPL
jgi:hypothetical protein